MCFWSATGIRSICFLHWCWTWLEIGGCRPPSKSTSCSVPSPPQRNTATVEYSFLCDLTLCTMKHGESSTGYGDMESNQRKNEKQTNRRNETETEENLLQDFKTSNALFCSPFSPPPLQREVSSQEKENFDLRQNWIDNQAALCCTLRVRMPKLLLQQALHSAKNAKPWPKWPRQGTSCRWVGIRTYPNIDDNTSYVFHVGGWHVVLRCTSCLYYRGWRR